MAAKTLKRTTGEYNPEVIYANPNIVTYFELTVGNDVLKSGDKVHIKGDTRTQWRFRHLAHNIELDSQWVDLISDMGFRSVRIEQLKFIRPVKKRSRRHKPNGV